MFFFIFFINDITAAIYEMARENENRRKKIMN